MKMDENALREKGWSEEEIEHARNVLERAEQNKHPHMKRLEKATYWMLLVIIIGGAIAIAWLMEPLLIVMTTTQAIIAFIILGAMFGTLASILIKDIEHAQQHHHVIIGLTIPVVAVISSVSIVAAVSELSLVFENIANHNPYILAAAFALATITPYSYQALRNKKRGSKNGTRRMDDTPHQVQGLHEKKD